jgi:hypothetical protein
MCRRSKHDFLIFPGLNGNQLDALLTFHIEPENNKDPVTSPGIEISKDAGDIYRYIDR